MSEPPPDGRRYLEDFAAGQTQTYGRHPVNAEEIIAFACQFDPQPLHTDPEAATASHYGGLIASGWHTTCIAMRLAVREGYLQDIAVVAGVGVEELRWTAPVRPGDVLSVREEILGTKPSASDPSQGLLRIEIEVLNEADESVMTMEWIDLVERREPGGG
jgi:acyl dehydratase